MVSEDLLAIIFGLWENSGSGLMIALLILILLILIIVFKT